MTLSSPSSDSASPVQLAGENGFRHGKAPPALPAPRRRWIGEFPEVARTRAANGSTPSGETLENKAYYDKRRGSFSLRLPAWLISTIFHTILLLILVLVQVGSSVASLSGLTARFDDKADDVVNFEPLPRPDAAVNSPQIGTAESLPNVLISALPSSAPLVVASPLADSDIHSPPYASAAPADLNANHGPTGLSHENFELVIGGVHRRDAQSRTELGDRYGASPASEDAVEAALRWLAEHQQRDGSWSFDLSLAPCDGRCEDSHNAAPFPRPRTAATGLALLAFLGAGYTHHEGKYEKEVRRGLYFLRDESRETKVGLDLQSGSMYGHGIASMAIGEAMAMTRYQGRRDDDLFALTAGAASFTVAAQHARGGWRYVPGSPGDMTVSSWQILSLISAKHGGVILPTPALPAAERFVRSLSKPGQYLFGYQTTTAEPATTAMGLCLLMYLGQSPQATPFARVLDQIVQRGPEYTDVYHDYYASLALHHARHPRWDSWHIPVRDHLVATQSKDGHQAGSWHFQDRHGDVGGRLYTTAMCAMILEVYYRYLPLYQTHKEFRLD